MTAIAALSAFEECGKREVLEMSENDLTWALEASVAQIALMWTVHQWEADEPNKPLDVQILKFSSRALSEMCAAYPILQNAIEELRWLTYSQGLIAAETHPRDQMLSAIDTTRRRADSTSSIKSAQKPSEVDTTLDADATLAAIDRALSNAGYSGRL
jgi:hypothetical protein